MRHSLKVAKWEIKRNLKNKTFLISLFLTPIIIVAFSFIGSFIGGSTYDSSDSNAEMTVYINDNIGIYDALENTIKESGLTWTLEKTDVTETETSDVLIDTVDTAYIFLQAEKLADGTVPVYTSEETADLFFADLQVLESVIMAHQMNEIGINPEQAQIINQGVYFEILDMTELAINESALDGAGATDDFHEKLVPAAFAAIIFISILFTGMAIFQSASLEKKDKIAEILLSSLTPSELMQGKIIGYFVLGLVQAAVLLVFLVPVVLYQTDIPIFEYLFVPKTLLYLILALFNYLMFAAILVGIGATMEDVSTAGNFQGLVLMLPFLPFLFIAPVLNDPSGIVAQVGTYIPFTAPGVLLMRLAVLDTWPWMEIMISLVIIVISTIFFIKLAGKIFKVGILMYGKNASPAEIWKWIRA